MNVEHISKGLFSNFCGLLPRHHSTVRGVAAATAALLLIAWSTAARAESNQPAFATTSNTAVVAFEMEGGRADLPRAPDTAPVTPTSLGCKLSAYITDRGPSGEARVWFSGWASSSSWHRITSAIAHVVKWTEKGPKHCLYLAMDVTAGPNDYNGKPNYMLYGKGYFGDKGPFAIDNIQLLDDQGHLSEVTVDLKSAWVYPRSWR